MSECKHGETSIVCTLCDLETIARFTDEEFAATCPPEPPTGNITKDTLVITPGNMDMHDWVPEMGWEEEDYE